MIRFKPIFVSLNKNEPKTPKKDELTQIQSKVLLTSALLTELMGKLFQISYQKMVE